MITLRLPYNLEALADLVPFIDEFCAHHGASEGDIGQVQLVAEEVFVNAVHHGGVPAGSEESAAGISFSASRAGHRLCFAMEDGGPPFDPTNGPEADVESNLDDRAIGGLGVHFLRRMMDEVRYERVGSINRLTFVKHIESALPE